MFAYWVHGDQLLFQNNKVLSNGGGLEASLIVLTRSRFINNTASDSGGGVYANADFNGSNLLFAGNDSASGAALYVKAGPAVLYHATIARPTQGTGSGIFIQSRSTLELKNSLICDYAEGIYVDGTLTEDYNLFYDNAKDTNISITGTHNQGLHNYLGNPLFINPAGGDYHLMWDFPAIDLGTDLGITTDLDGRARNNGRFDSGAYQFWASIYVPLISK